MRPRFSEVLEPPVPTEDITPSTCGLACTMRATWRCMATIASNETSCEASVNTNSWPLSSLGRNPLGAIANR